MISLLVNWWINREARAKEKITNKQTKKLNKISEIDEKPTKVVIRYGKKDEN